MVTVDDGLLVETRMVVDDELIVRPGVTVVIFDDELLEGTIVVMIGELLVGMVVVVDDELLFCMVVLFINRMPVCPFAVVVDELLVRAVEIGELSGCMRVVVNS